MTDLRQAAQQALEALGSSLYPQPRQMAAIAALKAALAEPVQEPFCYVYEYDSPLGLHREFYPREYNGMKPSRTVPLYTAPPQRKPLTETSAERTLKRLGYTDCGGEFWKPPLGAPAEPVQDPKEFDHGIGADRFKVVRGAFWWHVLIGDSTTEHGKFRSRASAEKMAADLLREFRNGAFVQHEAALAEPVQEPFALPCPTPKACKAHCCSGNCIPRSKA